jgi:hypothetical protein
MGDTSGQARTLTMMTPVRPSDVADLGAALDVLRLAPESFAGIGVLHFARFVVVDALGPVPPQFDPAPLHPPRLLFTAAFDGSRADFVASLRQVIAQPLGGSPHPADLAWSCCQGYPGTASAAAFALFVDRDSVPTTEFIAGYGDATVGDVTSALVLQDQVRTFAMTSQDLTAEQLRVRFTEAFGW